METPSFELGRSVSDNLDLWLVSGMGAAFMGGTYTHPWGCALTLGIVRTAWCVKPPPGIRSVVSKDRIFTF